MFTLGRKIDFTYRPNQLIVLTALLISAAGWILTGDMLSGIAIGGGVFLTWALSRELDPGHEYSAFVSAVPALLLLLYYDSVQFLIIVWLLLLMRMVNGVTGRELTAVDIVSVFGLTIYLSITNESSLYLAPFILTMLVLIRTKENTGLPLIAGGTALVFFIAGSFLLDDLTLNTVTLSDPLSLFAFAVLSLSFVIFWFLSKDDCRDDKGNRIERIRLLTAQLLFSATVLLFHIFGETSLDNLIIYLSALSGVALYFILSTVLRKVQTDILEESK